MRVPVSQRFMPASGILFCLAWPMLMENHRELKLPKNADGDEDGDGYTNLEQWLHGYAALVEGRAK